MDVLEPDRWSTEKPGNAFPSPIEPRPRECPEPLFKEVSEWWEDVVSLSIGPLLVDLLRRGLVVLIRLSIWSYTGVLNQPEVRKEVGRRAISPFMALKALYSVTSSQIATKRSLRVADVRLLSRETTRLTFDSICLISPM